MDLPYSIEESIEQLGSDQNGKMSIHNGRHEISDDEGDSEDDGTQGIQMV